LTAGDGGDGKLDGGGTVTLDPEAGFPLAITTKLAKLTAVRRDDVQAAASGNLTVSGTLRKAKIVSELTTDQVEVRVLDRLPPEVATLDVVELARAGARPPPDKPDAAPPVDADLDIRVEMPRRVFVRGRGIDSEWKGNVKVDGTASAPIVAGYLSLVRGQMTVVGKTFHMESGSFFLPEQGNNEPEMSLVAVHTARSLTVRAQVEGPVSRPTITLSSSPSLPQEEIVSQVLFNKSSSKLSVYEAAQLGIALSELTGKGGAGGVLDFVRKTLGVDSLQVESTETAKGSTPVVGAGKYLTDDVYVGVKQGATPESGSVGVEVEVTPHISVESEVKRSGQSDVGVKFKYDY
jgi:autotransporter translocation and assembly factor TamB